MRIIRQRPWLKMIMTIMTNITKMTIVITVRGDRLRKYGCFLEKFRRGVIYDPKNYIADFVGFKAVYFGRKFWKKCPKRGEGVISNPKNFIANLRKLTHIYEFLRKKIHLLKIGLTTLLLMAESIILILMHGT